MRPYVFAPPQRDGEAAVLQKVLTPEGYDELKEKLDYYLTKKRAEVSQRIAIARDFGDLSENSEYDAAKQEQAEVEAEIVAMQEQLANAEVIDESSMNLNEVGLGSRILLRDLELKEDFEFELLGSYEADPLQGKMSNVSPVTVNTPSGVLKYKIVDILAKN